MTSGGNNFNNFPDNQLTRIACSLDSIKAIPKMLCFVTPLWAGGGGTSPFPAPCSAAND